MASENDNTEQRTSSSDSAPAFGSCRRKKNFRSGSFVSDLRDHVHEFLHASADEHRTCLKDTIQKMFRTSKAVGEKSSGRIEDLLSRENGRRLCCGMPPFIRSLDCSACGTPYKVRMSVERTSKE
ncbi:hypothetical protein L484_020314 [Morus notabilis]|uniref:Uncharacterized protein n=1 Tax=Morus notabilis TaxID=981085 RepID=W9QS09_9ROSA|nr:hypothetical protein L484_020314 [Morus notabilis]